MGTQLCEIELKDIEEGEATSLSDSSICILCFIKELIHYQRVMVSNYLKSVYGLS